MRTAAATVICAAVVVVGTARAADARRLTPAGPVVSIAEETARTWTLPALEPGKGRVLLNWEARIHARRASGFREFMQVRINREPVGARADRLTVRLVNKPDRFSRNDGIPRFWFDHDVQSWVVVFAPDFETANKQTRYRFAGHAYDFSLDVTDLLEPGQTNELEIRNLTTHTYVRKWRPGRPATLFVRNLSVSTDGKPPAVTRPRVAAAKRTRLRDVSARVLPGGGIAIHVDGRRHVVRTRCSFPHGGWNPLAEATHSKGQEPGWQVRTSRDPCRVAGEGKFYTVDRTVSVHGSRIDAEDRFTNKSAADKLGLIIEHRLDCAGAMPRTVWMGGSSSPSLNDVGVPQNPTLFVPRGGYGLGLVCQDDVFRMQHECFYDEPGRSAGLRTAMFALGASVAQPERGQLARAERRSDETRREQAALRVRGARVNALLRVANGSEGDDSPTTNAAARGSYALHWSIYVVGSDDYYDFINRVREDWGVNTTILGAYSWRQARSTAHISPETMRDCVAKSGVRYICIWSNPTAKEAKGSPYVAIGAGGHHPKADAARGGHLAWLKAAAQRVHEAKVDAKILLMTNCFLNSVVEESDPATYRDSWYRNVGGKMMMYRRAANRFPTYLIYPTPGNSWGKRFAELLDYYVEECGADGIYWDEMTACGPNRKLTWGQWDGHSAQIDPEAKTIERLVGIVALMSSQYRRAQVEHLRAMGKFVHANGAPETTTLQTACNSRMVETKFVPVRVRELHLTTPFAYTYGTPTVRKIRERLERGALCCRSRLGPDPQPIMTHLFPFSPMELHAGWIKAKERIVTCRSGAFGWEGSFRARVWRFDAKGSAIGAEPSVEDYRGATVRVAVSSEGLAIVERVE